MNFDLLLRAVEIAGELKIPSTFVETNCYWCMNDKITREKLALLKEKGLEGVMISVNPFYAEYVPFERTERCIRISNEVFGKNVMIYQLEYYHRFIQLNINKRISLEEIGEAWVEPVGLARLLRQEKGCHHGPSPIYRASLLLRP